MYAGLAVPTVRRAARKAASSCLALVASTAFSVDTWRSRAISFFAVLTSRRKPAASFLLVST